LRKTLGPKKWSTPFLLKAESGSSKPEETLTNNYLSDENRQRKEFLDDGESNIFEDKVLTRSKTK
jgi:hypothetical protein